MTPFKSALYRGVAIWSAHEPPTSAFWSRAYSVLSVYLDSRKLMNAIGSDPAKMAALKAMLPKPDGESMTGTEIMVRDAAGPV